MINKKKYGLYLFVFALIVLLIAFFAESREYLVQKTRLETEMECLLKQAEKENEILREQKQQLIEEKQKLKEELEGYRNLSKYVKDSFLSMNPDMTEKKTNKLVSLFWEQVKLYNFKPEQVIAWIEQESEFYALAVSRKGAIGLTQIMPETGKDIARRLGIEWKGPEMLFDPEINLIFGFNHLDWGRGCSINEHQAFSMYFWGYGNVKKKGLVETAYSQDIFERSEMLVAEMRSV